MIRYVPQPDPDRDIHTGRTRLRVLRRLFGRDILVLQREWVCERDEIRMGEKIVTAWTVWRDAEPDDRLEPAAQGA